MKKRIAMLVLASCLAAAVFAGCGKNDTTEAGSADSSVAAGETVSPTVDADGNYVWASDSIEYDVNELVTLGDYENLAVTVTGNYEVTDDDVHSYIETMLTNYPRYVDSDKSVVEDGDIVNIDYSGVIDGEDLENGSAEGQNLEIGSGSFIDGFETGLIGATVGETLELNLTFPEDYYSEDIAGKDVVFTVTVNKIVIEEEVTYEEMTDDYVNETFAYETVDEFVEAQKSNLVASAESSMETDKQTAVLTELMNICEATVPQDLLDARVADYKVQFDNMCQSTYGVGMEEFITMYYGQTMDDFNAGLVDYLTEAIEQELVLEAIAADQNITLDNSDYNSFLTTYMAYTGASSEEEFYNANGGEKYIKQSFLDNEALTFVIDNANVTYEEAAEVTTEDLSADEETTEDTSADAE